MMFIRFLLPENIFLRKIVKIKLNLKKGIAKYLKIYYHINI